MEADQCCGVGCYSPDRLTVLVAAFEFCGWPFVTGVGYESQLARDVGYFIGYRLVGLEYLAHQAGKRVGYFS
jgi:hypothetical protein